ncbi:hypothetical protein ACFPRL_12165 [Pseudoclavibacter helvolus]
MRPSARWSSRSQARAARPVSSWACPPSACCWASPSVSTASGFSSGRRSASRALQEASRSCSPPSSGTGHSLRRRRDENPCPASLST